MSNYLYTLDNKILQHKGLTVDLVGENPVWNGLQSYWRLDETSGTVAADSKGSATGTLASGAFNSAGKRLYCWKSTTNAGNGITCGNNFNYERTDSFSWSFWTKHTTVGVTRVLISKQNPAAYADRRGYYIAINPSNKIYYNIVSNQAGGNLFHATINSPLINSTTDWYHIVVTYNGNSNASGWLTYINNTLATDVTVSTNALTTTTVSRSDTPFSIGGYNDGKFAVRGYMDEVGMWNRVLSQAEVTTLYNSGTGIFY